MTEIKKETQDTTQKIQKIDAELEEIMFKDAQKDKVAASVYKEVNALKGDFDKLITAIQEKNKLKTQIADV